MATSNPCKAGKCMKLKKRCYRVRWYDKAGKSKEKHFPTSRQAKEYKLQVEQELLLGVVSSERVQNITLNEFVKTIKLTQGNETTQAYTQQLYDKHIRDNIGRYKLRDITRIDIQNFIDEDLAGYSPALKKKVNRLFSVAFNYAGADGYIDRNPAKQVVIEGEKRLYEPIPLTPDQLDEFISIWDNDEILSEFVNVVVGLAFTGMRPQEIGAVKWEDVDLVNRTIDINKFIKKNPKGGQFVAEYGKTHHASRIIAIDDELLARLRFRKTSNPSDEWVFSSSMGKQLNLNNFRQRHFKKAILSCDLPITRPYDLRHTFSALMWSRGVSEDRLSKMMGHSNTKITRDWYGNWYREADFSGIKTLEQWKEEQA